MRGPRIWTLPPLPAPVAVVVLPAPSDVATLDFKMIFPSVPATALLALTAPF